MDRLQSHGLISATWVRTNTIATCLTIGLLVGVLKERLWQKAAHRAGKRSRGLFRDRLGQSLGEKDFPRRLRANLPREPGIDPSGVGQKGVGAQELRFGLGERPPENQ